MIREGAAVAEWLDRDSGVWHVVRGAPNERASDLTAWLRSRYGAELVDVRIRTAPCSRCRALFEPPEDRPHITRCERCRRRRDPAPTDAASGAGNTIHVEHAPTDVPSDTAEHDGEGLEVQRIVADDVTSSSASTLAAGDVASSLNTTTSNGEPA